MDIAKTLETHNAVHHKISYDKISQKNAIDSWQESERNNTVWLICQVQQLSHATEQKLSLEQSYPFFVERVTQQNICVLQESFILVLLLIINMSRH